MRGDILLYRTGGILKDRVVCAYTAGPFCHCEIDLGDGTCLGAHSEDGVSHTPSGLLDRRVVISLQDRTTSERREAGIAWAMQHVGEPFSWASIADLVLPPRLSTLVFGRRTLYNCANLVARYLEIAGGLDLPYGKRPPMIVSPNDIARAASLLPAPAGWGHSPVVRTVAALMALVPARSLRSRMSRAQTPATRAVKLLVALRWQRPGTDASGAAGVHIAHEDRAEDSPSGTLTSQEDCLAPAGVLPVPQPGRASQS